MVFFSGTLFLFEKKQHFFNHISVPGYVICDAINSPTHNHILT